MPIQTATQREHLAVAYGTNAALGAVYTTVPTTTAGAEPTGGSPAYARKSLVWVTGTVDGQVSVTVTFDIPAGTTVRGVGLHKADGTYLDGGPLKDAGGNVIEQPFAAQGTLTHTFTYTQT